MEASDKRQSIATFTEIGADVSCVKVLTHTLCMPARQIYALMNTVYPFTHLGATLHP